MKETVEEGRRLDAGKPRWDLMPPAALDMLARVFTMGADKYAPRNWERGMRWGRIFASAQRHLWAFWGGEDLDPESGLPHLAHAAWNILALLEYQLYALGQDDRSRRESLPPAPAETVGQERRGA